MKNARFVSWSVVFIFAIATISLVVAQSKPVVRAGQFADNQARPFSNTQGLPATSAAHRKGSSQASNLDFANAVVYGSGLYMQAVAVADLNGDGKPDLVVANGGCGIGSGYCGETSVSILLGNGDGTFQPEVTYDAGGSGVSSVAVADVNRDGKPDLVVVSGCPSSCDINQDGVVAVLLGNGDGTFRPLVSYDSGGENSDSVAIADFNGDGYPDLVVVNPCPSGGGMSGCLGSNSSVGVLLGNGDGTFQPVVFYGEGGQYAQSVAIGDVNGDGHLDLVVGDNSDDSAVKIMLGNGDGTFRAPYYINADGLAFSVVTGDLNNDGYLDVVVANGSYGAGVSVLLGNGDGTFRAPVGYSMGEGPVVVAVADVNGGGKLDIVGSNGCSGCSGGLASILLGNGDGTFQSVTSYGSGGFSARGVAVSDFNRDGVADIVAGNECNALTPIQICDGSSSPVGVLLGVPPGTATSTTVIASSVNPWIYGAPLALSATVTPPSGGAASGTVTFYDGWIAVGEASLSDNTASLSGLLPAMGWHLYTARYGGGEGIPGSTSEGLTEAVNQATTATTLVSNINPSYVSQAVTYKASVTGQYGGQVTGTVSFLQGERKQQITLCSATVTNGEAVCSTVYTKSGSQAIMALYSGDQNNVGSSSAVLKQKIKPLPAATKTVVATSGSPSMVGEAVMFKATVSSILPIADGEAVTFSNGNTILGVATMTNGVATLSTSFSKAGKYTIKAEYPGDASHNGSSGTVKQVVNP